MTALPLKTPYRRVAISSPGWLTRGFVAALFFSLVNTTLLAQVNELKFEGESHLSSQDEETFKTLVLEKVHLLTNYISLIGDKQQDNARRRDAIGLAIRIFMDQDRIVQVSSKSRNTTVNVPVRTYFQRLYSIDAGKVKITFYEVARITEFVTGKDGNLYGVAQIFQLFERFDGEGKLVYRDKTVKNVQVVVTTQEKFTGTGMEKIIDVKLGDIHVKETI